MGWSAVDHEAAQGTLQPAGAAGYAGQQGEPVCAGQPACPPVGLFLGDPVPDPVIDAELARGQRIETGQPPEREPFLPPRDTRAMPEDEGLR